MTNNKSDSVTTATKRICSVAGCGRPGRRLYPDHKAENAVRYCETHFKRAQEYGTPHHGGPIGRGRPDIRTGAVCDAEGCGRPVHSGGLCVTHWQRKRRTGEVKPYVPIAQKHEHSQDEMKEVS